MPLREKNGRWEYRFVINGDRVTKLTDLDATESNRSKAEKAEQKHRDSILKGEQTALRQVRRGFSDASEDFMKHVRIQHEAHPNTARRVETSLATLRAFFGKRPVAGVKSSDVNRYALWRRSEHKVRPVTLRHDLDALSKFFRWAITMDLCAANPVKAVDKPSTEDAVRMHVLTAAEEFEYFHRCEEDGYQNLADVARLIVEQGMRPDEVMTLERAACSPERVRVLKGKTKAAKRTLKLTLLSRAIVERRLAASDGRWLFPSPKRQGKPLTKLNTAHDAVCAADPERGRKALAFVLYDLRHTFATRAAERGMPLPTLAAILGHSSLRMITKYVHPTQDSMDAEMDRFQAHARPTAGRDQAHFEQSEAIETHEAKKAVIQ